MSRARSTFSWGCRWGGAIPTRGPFPDQYIDITGLDNGKYRLRATADPNGMFTESDYTNNGTWLDIRLSSRKGQTSVKVLGYGPGNNNGRGNNAAR